MTAKTRGATALAAQSWPTQRLTADPRNAREHSDSQIKQICRSIESFGFNVPILANTEGKVLAGHGRLRAAQKLGLAEVPVIVLSHLTEAQARAFAIADNKLTENSSWNEKFLGEVFLELSAAELNFRLDDTGFEMAEIDLLITGLKPDKEEDRELVPEFSSGPAVSRLGDVWQLGKHRIMCANALDATAYDSLLQGRCAHVLFLDFPFNVRIHGHASGLGKTRHREFPMASGEMSAEEYTVFLTNIFKLLVANSVEGSIHFSCIDWRHVGEMLTAGKSVYSELKNICVWVKDLAGMGSLYRSRHELVMVFKNGVAPHQNNIELGRHGRNRTNVWEYPSAASLSRKKGAENLLAMHATVKPRKLVADALLDCSSRGDLVMDVFLGSGTTLLAAESTGRICRGMELDPAYVDLAVARWVNMTGKRATHAVTGMDFEAMRDRRLNKIKRVRVVLDD